MWSIEEALAYYKRTGAPGDQSSLVSLLREVQDEHGGTIPSSVLPVLAAGLGVKESYLVAVIRRFPRLRLGDGHVLELCAGPNCGKATALAAAAERLCAQRGVTFRYMPCQRMCGKGPNLKLDGNLHHKANEALVKKLLDEL